MTISYSARIAAILAREINHKSKKHFGTLYSDALEEISMSNTSVVTSNMNTADTPASRVAIGREVPNDLQTLASLAPAKLTAEPSSDKITSGMAVASPLPTPAVAVRVDQRNLLTNEDSRKSYGDVAKQSLDAAADNGGPRMPMRGQKNSKYSNEDHPAFQSTSNADDSDAGN